MNRSRRARAALERVPALARTSTHLGVPSRRANCSGGSHVRRHVPAAGGESNLVRTGEAADDVRVGNGVAIRLDETHMSQSGSRLQRDQVAG
jgi:hypothetical protein